MPSNDTTKATSGESPPSPVRIDDVSLSLRSQLAPEARSLAVDGVLTIEGLIGLSEDDARGRLQQDGPNELPAQQKRKLLTIVLEVVREPMFLMLVAAGVVYLLLGEPADASMLLGFVFVVMAITIVQAQRTEHALDALRDLASPRALVIRGGQRRRIAGREVVAGDLVVLAEGDRVPADGLLRQALHLSADESLLTGESVPVRKVPAATATNLDRPGGDDLPSVFSGTLVHRGGENRSPAPRLAFSNQYCQPWARQQENFLQGVPVEVARQMPQRLQEMLGYSIYPPFMGQLTASHPAKLLGPAFENRVEAQARAAGARLPE